MCSPDMTNQDHLFPEDYLSGNSIIVDAVNKFYQDKDEESFFVLLDSFLYRICENGYVFVPVLDPESPDEQTDGNGRTTFDLEGMTLRLHHIHTNDGRVWVIAFTSEEERKKGERSMSILYPIGDLLESSTDIVEDGIIIDPWGQHFCLTKELIKTILNKLHEDA